MAKAKPNLIAALFCEKVLREADGVLSAIRIVDRVIAEIPKELPPSVQPVVELSALVGFKSGDAVGKYIVQLIPTTPSGRRLSGSQPFPIALQGKEHGHNLIIKFVLPVVEEGLYWFDLTLDDEIVTRMPLIVEHKPAETQPGAEQSEKLRQKSTAADSKADS